MRTTLHRPARLPVPTARFGACPTPWFDLAHHALSMVEGRRSGRRQGRVVLAARTGGRSPALILARSRQIEGEASPLADSVETTSATKVSLPVTGMTCAACARTIEVTLAGHARRRAGRRELRDRPGDRRRSTRRPSASTDLVAAVRDVGYDVLDTREAAARPGAEGRPVPSRRDGIEDLQQQAHRAEYLTLRRKFVVAVALSLPIMVIGMAHLQFPGVNWVQLAAGRARRRLLRRAVLPRRLEGLRHRNADMNTLIAVGTGRRRSPTRWSSPSRPAW